MEFVPHPDETRRIGAPLDWDPAKHGPCGALSVSDITTDAGLRLMESLWRPDSADLAAVAAGGAFVLGVAGPCPFVRLTVVAKGHHRPLVAGEPKPIGEELAIGIGLTEDGLLYPFFTTPVAGEGGVRFQESVWRHQGRAASLAEGGLIAVAVGGAQHPVVYLGVTTPPQHDGASGPP
jgi:hypothetical protein